MDELLILCRATKVLCSFLCLFVFRRESERRNHSLARHADILAAVETRLSLLNMTFMKYVDSNLCCFIPGKVSSISVWVRNKAEEPAIELPSVLKRANATAGFFNLFSN